MLRIIRFPKIYLELFKNGPKQNLNGQNGLSQPDSDWLRWELGQVSHDPTWVQSNTVGRQWDGHKRNSSTVA